MVDAPIRAAPKMSDLSREAVGIECMCVCVSVCACVCLCMYVCLYVKRGGVVVILCVCAYVCGVV